MNLILTITKSPEGVSLAQAQQVFGEAGGGIGRAKHNSWVLQDPERYISSTHCRIEYENGCFYLVDNSTNGTFLNNADQPVGKGERAELVDGMTFSVGDYEFAIAISDDPSSSQQSLPQQTPIDSASIPGVAGPFDALNSASSQPENPPVDRSSEFGSELPLAGDAGRYEPVHITPHQESVIPGQENILDPLHMLDRVKRQNTADIFPAGNDTGFEASQADHAPLADQAFVPPKVGHKETIPEDWDNTEYGFHEKQKFVDGVKDKRQPGASSHLELMPEDDFGEAVVANRPRVAAKQQQAKRRRTSQHAGNQQPGKQRKAAVGGNAHAETSAVQSPFDVRAAAQAVDNNLLAAIGLDKSNFSPEQLAQLNTVVGQFVRHTVEGLLKVLRARSTIKNELRLGVTTVQPRDNNPIKFSADVDDALEHLFLRHGKAYLPPIASVNESFETILDHQVAVLAGMRAAFKSLIQKFDPVQLSAKFEAQAGSGIFSGAKKLKHWDAYSDFYNTQVRDLDSSFEHLFGEEFVKAYESQLVQLSIARKQEKQDE